jgi:hypothetical protein
MPQIEMLPKRLDRFVNKIYTIYQGSMGVSMKKIAVFAVILACVLVVGCEIKSYTVVIENKSENPVTYIYNDSTKTLSSGISEPYYGVKPYTQPPIITDPDQSDEKSIEIKYDTITGNYTFFDKK